MEDIACQCGHGSTQHTEALIGYACTICPCPLLRSATPARWVEVPDDTLSRDDVYPVDGDDG